MYIQQITSRHRNDFTAIMSCEHCEKEAKLTTGYDDANYHDNVIPTFYCSHCNKNRAGELKEIKS